MKRGKRKSEPKWGLWVAAIIVTLLLLFFGYMLIQANTVHLMRATVYLADLPESFEGRSLLYVSDIDLGGLTTPKKAAEAILRMQGLKPDMLILGGDYTTYTLPRVLDSATELNADDLQRREAFFDALNEFSAPLGKYALAAPEDGSYLPAVLEPNGFALLNDSRHRITVGNDQLWLVGVNQNSDGVRKGGRLFQSEECVIAVADSPSCFPMLNTGEAANGGHWVDLCLAGHTHGGQVTVLGRSMLKLDALEQQFIYGWNHETGVPMLTTSGLGCEGVNIRLNTQAELWLITLTGHKQ